MVHRDEVSHRGSLPLGSLESGLAGCESLLWSVRGGYQGQLRGGDPGDKIQTEAWRRDWAELSLCAKLLSTRAGERVVLRFGHQGR